MGSVLPSLNFTTFPIIPAYHQLRPLRALPLRLFRIVAPCPSLFLLITTVSFLESTIPFSSPQSLDIFESLFRLSNKFLASCEKLAELSTTIIGCTHQTEVPAGACTALQCSNAFSSNFMDSSMLVDRQAAYQCTLGLCFDPPADLRFNICARGRVFLPRPSDEVFFPGIGLVRRRQRDREEWLASNPVHEKLNKDFVFAQISEHIRRVCVSELLREDFRITVSDAERNDCAHVSEDRVPNRLTQLFGVLVGQG